MPGDFTDATAEVVGGKLNQARLAAGLSTREVAAKLSEQHSVSHATIANYEKGRSSPPLPLLSALADLYGKPLIWFVRSAPTLSGVRYRYRKSKLKQSELKWYEANAARLLEAYAQLERRLDMPLKKTIDLLALPDESGAAYAARLRKKLDLNDADPIPSMVDVLERFGVRTVELPTDLSIDGLAATFGTEFAVVLNPNTSNDRCRMIAGHELGHVAFGDCDAGAPAEDSATEKRAFEVASHVILPDSQLKLAFAGQSMVRLVQFKERFGISLAGMIYRAQSSGIINQSTSKWLWIEFTKRGWRTNEPGQVRPDRATRFEQLFDGAIAQGKMSWGEATHITGMREDELRDRVRLALGGVSVEEKGDDEPNDNVLKFPH